MAKEKIIKWIQAEKWSEIELFLIENKHEISFAEDRSAGYELLKAMVFNNQPILAELLLEADAPIVDANDQVSLLHASIIENYLQISKLLIKYGANVDDDSNLGKITPLLAAVCCNSLESGELLIINKAKLNIQDSAGNTALQIAVDKGNPLFVKLLLDAGADTTIANISNYIPLYHAAELGEIEIFELLIDKMKKDDVITRNIISKTAFKASNKGNIEIIKYLSTNFPKEVYFSKITSQNKDVCIENVLKHFDIPIEIQTKPSNNSVATNSVGALVIPAEHAKYYLEQPLNHNNQNDVEPSGNSLEQYN